MENKFGIVFQTISSIVGITIGVAIMLYKKRFLELQKRYFSKHNDFFSRQALKNLQTRSNLHNTLLSFIVGVGLIAISIFQLINLPLG